MGLIPAVRPTYSTVKTINALQSMIRNGIPKFFSSKNDSEQNSEVFSLPKMVWNGIPRFFSSKNGSEWNSQGFSLPRNGSELNSEGL